MRAALVLAVLFAIPAEASAASFTLGSVDGPLKSSVENAIKRGAEGRATIGSGPAIVSAKVERDGRRWRVTLQVSDNTGRVHKKWIVRAKKPRRATYLIEKGFWKKLGGTIERLAPAEAAPPPPAAPPTPVAAPPPPVAAPPPPVAPPPPPVAPPPPPVAPPPAPAATGGPAQVVLLKLSGGSKARAEAAIVKALEADDRYDFAPVAGVEGAGNVTTASGRVAVARTLGITAWLEVTAQYRRKRYRVTLRVLDGSTGAELETTDIVSRNKRSMQSGIKKALRRILPKSSIPAAAAAPPPPPPVAAAPPPRAAPAASSASPAKVEKEIEVPRGPSVMNNAMVIARLDFHMFTRNLSYNDDLFGELRPYEILGAPAVGGAVTWFVGESFTRDWWRHLALDISGHYGFALASENSAGEQFPTSSLAWDIGAYGRLPLGTHEIGALVGIGGESFSIDASEGGVAPEIPAVGYVSLRVGGRFRFFVTEQVSVRGEGAYRLVVGAGEIRDDIWFPRASVGAADAQLGVTYDIASGFFADAGFAMRRYFYTLNPEPGDPFIAGGAADQYFIGNVGIGWYH